MNWGYFWIAVGAWLLVDTISDWRKGQVSSRYSKVVKTSENVAQFYRLLFMNVAMYVGAIVWGVVHRHDPQWEWTTQPTAAAAIAIIKANVEQQLSTSSSGSRIGLVMLAAAIIYVVFWKGNKGGTSP